MFPFSILGPHVIILPPSLVSIYFHFGVRTDNTRVLFCSIIHVRSLFLLPKRFAKCDSLSGALPCGSLAPMSSPSDANQSICDINTWHTSPLATLLGHDTIAGIKVPPSNALYLFPR